MVRNDIISYYIILLFLPVLSVAGSLTPILNSIQPQKITIIGENHRHSESVDLFQVLIKGYLKNNKCLTIALEINSHQQPIINQVIQGRAVVSDIEISSIIDHVALRNMIDDLVTQKKNGACLEVLAIDAGDDVNMERDEWMAANLAKQIGKTPVLVLLGNLHTLKKVNWDLSMTTHGSPSVAEILNNQGYRVDSYPQRWLETKCASPQQLRYRFIPADTAEALTLLNTSMFSLLNAFEPDSAIGVIDGAVLWECS